MEETEWHAAPVDDAFDDLETWLRILLFAPSVIVLVEVHKLIRRDT